MEKKGLAQKKCVPCEGGIEPLSKNAAQGFLGQVIGWSLVEDAKKIQKKFRFNGFDDAMGFVNNVAGIARKENHHPDIFISYNKVTITIFTHAIGGLHENDFVLAAKIDRITH